MTPSSSASRIHPAWVVLVAVTVCMMASSGLRSVFGVYIKPMEAEFGWTRGALSGVAAISLLLLGAAGPFAGRLADRWGPRRLIVLALILLGGGALGASATHALWQLYVTTGVLMGIGSAGLGMATAAVIATRWFEARRGLAIGIVAGGMSAGQLVIIPLAATLMLRFGWRVSLLWLGLGALAIVVPLALWLVHNDPLDRGLRPYGSTGPALTAAQTVDARRVGRVGVFEAAQHPQFWLLMATFFVCGYTTNGMVLTHFMPHALEHGFTELQASTALGVMGAMNMLGTVASGFFCDRFGRRGPLATYYFLRGVSLIYLVYVWNAPSLHLWAAIYGLNYISTLPPTTALTASIFGRWSVGELSGWIFFAHQVGAALGAAGAGWVFELYGSYNPAFISAGLLGILAAVLTMLIREESVITRPLEPAPV